MAIPKFTSDVSVISKLGTKPNTDNGLSDEQLKAKFDEAPNLIKEYINNKLVPAVAQVETNASNARALAEGIAPIASDAAQLAAAAKQEAENAASEASDAKNIANNKSGVKREFSSGSITQTSYTTPGSLSKFYMVTISDAGWIQSFAIDWMAVSVMGTTNFAYVVKWDDANAARGYLTATVNADNTVTFSVSRSSAIIRHVCGYY